MRIENVNANGLNDLQSKVNFTLNVNATSAWKKANMPEGEDFIEFCKEYLNKKKLTEAGSGCYIIKTQYIKDGTNKPYKITNVPSNGRRKVKRVFELINSETGAIMGEADSRTEALQLAKDLITNQRTELGVGVEHHCHIKYKVSNGDDRAFSFKYSPSKKYQEGEYIVFGTSYNEI